jgi:hypothetical protein
MWEMVYSRICLVFQREKAAECVKCIMSCVDYPGVPSAVPSLVQCPERYSTAEGDLATLNSTVLPGLLVKVNANKGKDYVSIVMQIDLLRAEVLPVYLAGLLELVLGTWLLASV